jgi:thiol-disulfide isomerase/thioredoxin
MVRYLTAAIALAALFVSAPAGAQQILLLDFWSPHCGPCMQMKPIVDSYERAHWPIRSVDTTRDGQLSQQYGVTQIPCFVMLVDGQEVERQVGAIGSEGIQQMFERAKDEVKRRAGTRAQSPDLVATAQRGLPAANAAEGPAQQPMEQSWPANGSVSGERSTFNNAAAPGNAPASAHPALIAATVRLYVEDSQGRSCGTGTIVDTRSGEALVVTCGHLFRETKGKAPVKADLFEAGGDAGQVAGHATGTVLSYDLARDVALVSIRVDRPVTPVAVAPPKTSVERGDRVVGVGCSNGNDPTVLETRVTSLDRYQGPPNIEASGAPAIGRSGGGLFNGKNELIGVCNNADPEGNEGIYAGRESIHDQLDRLGLKDIYAKGSAAPPAKEIVLGQAPSNDAAPTPLSGLSPAAQPKATGPRNLSETEQAALEEIMSRAVSSEVVCIVRPKDANGQSEVIHLDNVSPEFIRALKQRTAPATVTR